MKISLIITTYNWKEALNIVLKSILEQTVMPHEVIIADDGSKQDTIELVQQWQEHYPIPLIHSWQEDDGFRVAESRNKAIAKATGDYIVIIDGDMVLSKEFIESYSKAAKKGWFIQAGRVPTDLFQKERIIQSGELPNFFSKGVKNRKNSVSCSFLSKLFSFERNNSKSTRGCNMGFWLSDAIEVNGFNNDFVGWGREDSEFVIRMLNAGKRRLYLKFGAVAYHLYHPEYERESLSQNDQILKDTIKNQSTFCMNGVDRFIVNDHQ